MKERESVAAPVEEEKCFDSESKDRNSSPRRASNFDSQFIKDARGTGRWVGAEPGGLVG